MSTKHIKSIAIVEEVIENKIFLIRGVKMMIDRDLAVLYGVETKTLNQAVKRNIERFPEDFMFQLTKEEADSLRSQIVTSNRGGRRYLPYAFTEHGILMLSSVLNSPRAIQVNIQIMRTFTRLQKMLAGHSELKRKIEKMEGKYDRQFRAVFEAIKKLLASPAKPKNPIGFHAQ